METAERYLTKKKDAQHKEYLLKFICAFLGLFASICFLLVVVLTYRNVQLESDNSELVGNLRQLSSNSLNFNNHHPFTIYNVSFLTCIINCYSLTECRSDPKPNRSRYNALWSETTGNHEPR